MQGLDQETACLLYGQKMIDFLQEKGAFSQIKHYALIANFRKAYYLKHQQFYDGLIPNTMKTGKKTVLYAPTWQDAEKSSSFYSAVAPIIENLPQDWTLIIKPHPNLLLEDNLQSHRLLETYADRDRVFFLSDFPPIHPLLALADLYIGDMSSIGYDFLSWNKPMFFLNEQKRDSKKDPGLYLYRCGIEIAPDQYKDIYATITNELEYDSSLFSAIRKEVDFYTFGPTLSLEQIKQNILSLWEKSFDSTLNFF
jgi:CDP-glycerol glycerophosphotransferase (TagB/SpsB family)